MKIKLSIIILNWNSKEDLKKCLISIYKNTLLKEKEIIVVDNGSRDGSVEFIEKSYPEIVLIRNEKNRGVGPARNQGMKISKGEYIMVLDVDTEIQPKAIDNLIEAMEKYPQVGLCGPKLIFPSGRIQYSCRKFPNILSKFVFRRLPERLSSIFLLKEEYRKWDHSSPRCVGYVIGACQLIRRKAMNQVGFYDERIFYGPEDIDYCLRMWKAGWKVLYYPRAEIIHKESRITKGIFSQLKNPIFWEHIKGLLVYFRKHRYFLKRPTPEKESNLN